MKKIFLLIAAFAMFSASSVQAQGLGLPNLVDYNEKTLGVSDYVAFQTNGSNYMFLQTEWIDVLKLPSVTTFGGYSIMNEKCTDIVNKKSMKAIRFRANSSTGIGKILSSAAGMGSQSPDYYLDEVEIPKLISKLKEFQALTTQAPDYTCAHTYICKGGLQVSVGFRKADADKKEAVWLGSIAASGDMPLKDILDFLIKTIEKANEKLAKM